MAFHDLTAPQTNTPKNLSSLLGLGLKFCPIPRHTNNFPIEHLLRFQKDLNNKVFFSGRPPDPNRTPINPKLYIESGWQPMPWHIPREIHQRRSNFETAIASTFRKSKRKTQNLLPSQKRAMSQLMQRDDLLVVPADKNLGTVLIDTATYINKAFTEHLNNSEAYRELSLEDADEICLKLREKLETWLKNIIDR